MFWFIVAVVFLVLWIQERKDSQKLRQEINSLKTTSTTGQSVAQSATNVQPNAVAAPVATVAPTSISLQPQAQSQAPPQPTPTEEELTQIRENRSQHNLNLLLYTGSFLIVAAMGLFMTLTLPSYMKLSGLVLATLIFYSGGLVLYEESKRLKMAATAFVGTGLAILPFNGVALILLGGVSPTSAWVAISLIGLVAYAMAAIKLQSQLISYLTIAFVISLSLSIISSGGLTIVWYFVTVVLVTTILSAINYFKPKLIPKVFIQPIEKSSIIATPIALVLSLIAYNGMSLLYYKILFGVATLHYLVQWLEYKKWGYELSARALLQITIMLFVIDAVPFYEESGRIAINIWWYALLAVQVIFSMVRAKAAGVKVVAEETVVGVASGLMVLSLPMWASIDNGELGVAISLLTVGAITTAAAFRFKHVFWGYGSLAISVILPIYIMRQVITPSLPYEYVSMIFALFGAGLMGYMWSKRQQVLQWGNNNVGVFLSVSMMTYITMTVLTGYITENPLSAMLSGLVGVVLSLTLSYLMQKSWALIAANISLMIVINMIWEWGGLDSEWRLSGVLAISAAIFYAMYWLHTSSSDKERQLISLFSTVTALMFGVMINILSSDTGHVVFASLSLLAVSAIIGQYAYTKKIYHLVEGMIYLATFALQRLVGVLYPDASLLVLYGHWWAATIIAVGIIRKMLNNERIAIALVFLSAPTAWMALIDGGTYQLLFLVESAAIAVAGFAYKRQWIQWWGIVSVILSVLYFIKGYTTLILLLLGFALIGFVVWKLTRPKK